MGTPRPPLLPILQCATLVAESFGALQAVRLRPGHSRLIRPEQLHFSTGLEVPGGSRPAAVLARPEVTQRPADQHATGRTFFVHKTGLARSIKVTFHRNSFFWLAILLI